MIRPFHLEDFVARLHENGSAQSFSACAFTYKGQKLQAVMFGNREFMTHGYCAVLSNDVNINSGAATNLSQPYAS
jgi:hypothetical protein